MARVLPVALAAIAGVSMLTLHAGGWAVITVEDLPEQFVSGTASTLTFSVRQHGTHLVSGLRGSVSASSRGRLIEAAATPARPGYYTAEITLPQPGEWLITINSGFVTSRVTLLPVTAVADAASSAPVPLAHRGRELFVAKGCNSCHHHGDLDQYPATRIATDLTDKRYSDALLAKVLEDPSIVPALGTWTMPNLNLRQSEVAALVAFINKPRVVP